MRSENELINIAKGIYDEDKLLIPLNDEEKKYVYELKEYFEELRNVGLEDLIRAYYSISED